MRSRRSLLVAATMRTLVLIGVRPPTVVYSPCCSTRSKRRLRLHRHVADLVEKQRAAFGLFEAPGGALVGAGEGALLVAEQFALDEVARNRRHVDGDERAFLALAVIVQRAGHQLLAGAGLAGDQHGEVGLHQPRERAIDLLHRRRAADERHALDLLGRRRRRRSCAARPSRGRRSPTSSLRSKGFGR